jgi:LmbE family N-acetylglucosaminyl deacetylase
VFVPDGADAPEALSRTTDLAVVAHPDDLEFLAIAPIGACRDAPDRSFGGVVCTDGAGSTQAGASAPLAAGELAALRWAEQREAARIGRYGFVVGLGHASAHVRSTDGQRELVGQLVELLAATRPTNLYTHNLADKHATHVAVAAATVKAVRSLPVDERPLRMVGVEGWRSLDWLPDHEKVRMDVTPWSSLAAELAAVFGSQLCAKRYDLAVEGQRRANATLFEPRRPDDAEQVVVAMDLTPLARNDDLDPVRYVTAAVDRFRAEVNGVVAAYFD